MKKKVFNKKMSLSILAGVLVTIAIIGAGTYAWFTSSADTSEGEFHTATVRLTEATGEYGVYEFLHNNTFNIGVQTELEALYGEDDANSLLANMLMGFDCENNALSAADFATMEEYYEYLKDLVDEAQDAYDIAADNLQAAKDALQGINDAIDQKLTEEPDREDFVLFELFGFKIYDVFAYNRAMNTWRGELRDLYLQLPEATRDELSAQSTFESFESALNDAVSTANDYATILFSKLVYVVGDNLLVTPGSIIYGDFIIENESDIETYLRISGAEISNDLPLVAIARYNDNTLCELIDGGDGYYYCPQKVDAFDTVEIIIGVYVFGDANVEASMDVYFAISGMTVELIQATNNAVHFADGWADFSLLYPTFFN